MKINNKQHVTKDGVVKRNPPRANSSLKKEVYAGHWVAENKPFSFSLYPGEDINVDATIKNIMNNMNSNHLQPMRELFAKAGLYLHGFKWYSPSSYNYEGDNVDLVVSVADRERLLAFIRANAGNLQKLLSGNSSRDGYIATTADNIDEVIENINDNFDVDTMVISYIQSMYPLDIYNDYYDLIIEEEDEDDG